jgi:hypothetical protein
MLRHCFLSRRIFRCFAEEIAWGTQVWIANEAAHLITFGSEGTTQTPLRLALRKVAIVKAGGILVHRHMPTAKTD